MKAMHAYTMLNVLPGTVLVMHQAAANMFDVQAVWVEMADCDAW